MMVVMLIGALVVPFFMKGPDGKPIVTMEKMIDDSVPDAVADIVPSKPVEMYRWKNEHGIWEFGEAPPEEVAAARMSVDNSRTTTMGSEWNVAPLFDDAEGDADAIDFQMPNSMADAYRAAPELMGAAKRAASVLNDRQAGMDDQLGNLMKQIQQ